MFVDLKKLKVFDKLKLRDYVTDHLLYRVHYMFTFAILIVSSFLVTARQYFGPAIQCINGSKLARKFVETYCWVHTTFSVDDAWFKRVGKAVPYPGVDKATPTLSTTHHAYYQWVCVALFLQALGFYLPRLIWKRTENRLICKLCDGLTKPVFKTRKEAEYAKVQLALVADYLYDSMRRNARHTHLFVVYVFTEVLNLVNVVVQLRLLNKFFGGKFANFGIEVMSFTEWDQIEGYDPMMRLFPSVTKCTFHQTGQSGDVEKHDLMCLLPINVINKKLYIFIWFWLHLVLCLTIVHLVYRIGTIALKGLRVWALIRTARHCPSLLLHKVVRNCSRSDWFVLHLIARNIHSQNFCDLMAELEKLMKMHKEP